MGRQILMRHQIRQRLQHRPMVGHQEPVWNKAKPVRMKRVQIRAALVEPPQMPRAEVRIHPTIRIHCWQTSRRPMTAKRKLHPVKAKRKSQAAVVIGSEESVREFVW